MREVGKEMGITVVTDRRQVFMMPPAARAEYLASIQPVIDRIANTPEALSAPPVDVADFVDHVTTSSQIGIDHVGISSDFDGGGGVQGWNDADETFNVTLELVKRGYTEAESTTLERELIARNGPRQAIAAQQQQSIAEVAQSNQ